MALSAGYILNNRYRIVKPLSEGGFGMVYRAWDLHLNKVCAVKENFDVSPAAQTQFTQEASLLAGLRHPNLPVVHDHFFIAGQGQYLVMDFVEGDDLQQKIDAQGALPEAETLGWLEQICEALIYLHTQTPPIIHRDLKPANIKITPQGKAVLVDFGIAKVFDPQLKTMKGAQAFTPGYSPIEQYGKGMTDERSDIYALAATLYAALTGAIPAESVQRNLSSPLVPPRSLKPSITPATEGAILKAMEVVPADRYRTMSEFKKALRPSPLAPTVAVDQTAEMPISVMLPAISSSASFARAKSPPKNQDSNFWTCLFAIFLFAMLIMFVCICGVVFLLTAPSSFWRSLGF